MSGRRIGYCSRCSDDGVLVMDARTIRGVEITLCDFCAMHTSADLPNGIELHHIWRALAHIWRKLEEASRER